MPGLKNAAMATHSIPLPSRRQFDGAKDVRPELDAPHTPVSHPLDVDAPIRRQLAKSGHPVGDGLPADAKALGQRSLAAENRDCSLEGF